MRLPLLLLLLSSASLAQGSLLLSDTLIVFNDVFVSDSSEKVLTLYNNGESTLYLQSAQSDDDAFRVGNHERLLAAGASIDIPLIFRPAQNIAYDRFVLLRFRDGDRDFKCRLRGNGRLENSYYASSFNLWGNDLKQALHNTIKGHVEFSYSDVWDILRDSDEDPDNSNNVILLYTGWSYAKSNNGGGASNWNREHVWAKSHGDFGKTPPAGTDVHHLRPTDVTVNSKRGSLDFDNGGTLYTDGDGPTECRYDNDSWEPRDAVKGDVARMMYYMAVRYEADDPYDLELVEKTGTSGPVFGRRSTLYNWHNQDPVSDFERRRNEIIYTDYQKNRNPFIDFPAFVDRLPSLSGRSDTHLQGRMFVLGDSVIMASVEPGAPGRFNLICVNSGGTDVQVSDISVEGPFSVSHTSFTVPAGASAGFEVRFNAAAQSGEYTGELTIVSDAPDRPEQSLPLHIKVQTATTLLDGENPVPDAFTVRPNYPNPFNGLTRFWVYSPRAEKLRLDLYDVRGQHVLRKDIPAAAGWRVISLNPGALSGGLYFYSFSNGRLIQNGKMVYLP